MRYGGGLSLAEDLAEEIGDPSGGVGSDALFLLADDVKEAVQRPPDDVPIEIERLEIDEGQPLRTAEELLVLPRHADLAHRPVHDR